MMKEPEQVADLTELNMRVERLERTGNFLCGATITLPTDYDSPHSCTFGCRLPMKHTGLHVEYGNVPGILDEKKEAPYTMTWKEASEA